MQTILKTTTEKMNKAIASYEHDLTSVRTGRATPALLENIEVEYYGSMTPINQMSSVTVAEGRQLLIKAFDKGTLKEIENAILKANLGFNPQNDGMVIRINVPALTEERRKEMTKIVSKMAEEAKVAVRNIRRDANDLIKKEKDMPEDMQKDGTDKVQKLTDDMIKKIDKIAEEKSKEIMSV